MAETAKYQGKDVTWSQLVKKLGVDRARVAAPELDPKYQQMVKSEGQAKANVDYTKQFVDPQTIHTPAFGSPEEIQAGIQMEKQRGGLLPGIEAGIGSTIMGGPSGTAIGRALFGGKAATDPKQAAKTGGATSPAAQPKQTFGQAEDQAINQMFQGLLGQFTSAENTVNPYISGANSGQAASNAQALANHFAGGGVASPDQNVAGILNKDAQAYAAANQAGQQGIANAIGQVNTANQAAANVSPYGQLLNALASKAQYNIVYQGAQPNVASSPQFVQEALASANQYQPSGVTGASPVGTTPSPVTTGSGSTVPPSTTVSSSAGG